MTADLKDKFGLGGATNDDCNGNENGKNDDVASCNGNENGKNDAAAAADADADADTDTDVDSSYVLVSGSDEATDLNGKPQPAEKNNEEIGPNNTAAASVQEKEHVTEESQINVSSESDLDAVVSAAGERSIDSTSQLEFQVTITDQDQDQDQDQSANANAVDGETQSDSVVDIRDNQDSNGVQNDLDLDQEKEINDLSQKEENFQTPVLPPDAKMDEYAAQDSVAETPLVEDLVDANQNASQPNSSSENVDAVTSSDDETGNNFPTPTDGHIIGEPTTDIPVPDQQLEESEVDENHHAQDIISHSVLVNDFVQANQATPEQNPLEPSASPFVLDNAPVETNESIPADHISDMMTIETEAENSRLNGNGDPVDDTNVEIGAENGLVVNDDTKQSCTADDVKPEIQSGSVSIVSEEKLDTFSSADVDIVSEASNGVADCAGSNLVSIDIINPDGHDSVENETCLPSCPVDVKAESEVENTSMIPMEDMANKNVAVSESEVLNGSVNTSERTLDCMQEGVHVDDEEGQVISTEDDKKTCREVEDNDEVLRNGTSTSTPEDSSVDASDGQNAAAEVGKRPFYYMIRIPRYDDDENLKEEIKGAQFQVEEKTKSRDAIQPEIQIKRANCREYDGRVEAAISEEKAVRDLLKAKRKEIDSVQSVINRVKNATEVEEIDGRIRNMEHMIQHETLPLKEEKQFIREIKHLKQIREQLSSNMGSQDKVQQAMDQKDQVEERLKFLRKEAELLRDKVLKAEAATKDAKEKYRVENDKLIELQTQFRAANETRQKAYAYLQGLKKQLYNKNKHFWKYKDDANAAIDLAFKGDKEELQRHCVNQVERVMEQWNNNDEFRKEYMRCNMRSTLRRLRTLDGRSLGPDEEPPVISIVVSEKVAKDNIVPLTPTLEGEKAVVAVDTLKTDDKSTAKVGDQKNQTVKAKKPAKPTPSGNGLATVSARDQIEEVRPEEQKKAREEEELARKAEELRKEEEAAMLKEQRRLEEKVKAKEAMERKKRNADKAQTRAALRAQKEAEQKEKEREKRARKKEKRKAAGEDTNAINEGESAPGCETPSETIESEKGEKPVTVAKRSQKPSQFTKQTKAKSMPLPLRNRGKRRMQTWMWALLTALVVFALFLLGNSGFSFNFGLQRFGF